MNRLVLFGAYGLGNLGDELLADYYRSLVYAAFPDFTRLFVTAGHIRSHYPGELIYNRQQVFSLLCGIKKGDLWIAGGGSLLQNYTSRRSLLFYVALLELAALRGARIAMLGQGYGPIYGNMWITVVRHVLSRTHLIECRDFLSYQRLQTMPLKNVRIQRGVDPSWGLELPFQIRKGNGLLLIVKRMDRDRVSKIWATLSRNRLSEQIKVIALDETDETFLRMVFGGNYCGTTRDLVSFLTFSEGTRGVLSSRLHGIILGALAGLPAIGLGDDPKIVAICKELGFAVDFLNGLEDYEALPKLIAEMNFNSSTGGQIESLKERAQKAKISIEATLHELGDGNECGSTS